MSDCYGNGLEDPGNGQRQNHAGKETKEHWCCAINGVLLPRGKKYINEVFNKLSKLGMQ